MGRSITARVRYWIAVEKDRRQSAVSRMRGLRTHRLRKLATKEVLVVASLCITAVLLPVLLIPMIMQSNVMLVGVGYLILGMGLLLMQAERRIYILYHITRILAKRVH